jgi:mannosyl-oligosaccharide alpha-1,2-mannosidase
MLEQANSTSTAPADATAFYAEHGYYIQDGYNYYDLRPEVLESNFCEQHSVHVSPRSLINLPFLDAWRYTGNTTYLDRASSFIASLQKYAALNGAYAGFVGIDSRQLTSIFLTCAI